jgi:hypothetical protein
MDKSPYNKPLFRKAAGLTLRPGGLAITEKGLELCAWKEKSLVADIGCGLGATLNTDEIQGLAFRGTGYVSGFDTGSADKFGLSNGFWGGLSSCLGLMSIWMDGLRKRFITD